MPPPIYAGIVGWTRPNRSMSGRRRRCWDPRTVRAPRRASVAVGALTVVEGPFVLHQGQCTYVHGVLRSGSGGGVELMQAGRDDRARQSEERPARLGVAFDAGMLSRHEFSATGTTDVLLHHR